MNEKEIKSLLQRYYKEQHALKVKNRLQEYYNIKLKENSLASFDEIIGEEKLDQLSVNDSEVKNIFFTCRF